MPEQAVEVGTERVIRNRKKHPVITPQERAAKLHLALLNRDAQMHELRSAREKVDPGVQVPEAGVATATVSTTAPAKTPTAPTAPKPVFNSPSTEPRKGQAMRIAPSASSSAWYQGSNKN